MEYLILCRYMQIVNTFFFFNGSANKSGVYTLAFVAAVLIISKLIRQLFNVSCDDSIANALSHCFPLNAFFLFVVQLWLFVVFVWLINVNHKIQLCAFCTANQQPTKSNTIPRLFHSHSLSRMLSLFEPQPKATCLLIFKSK